jgi:snapalysin
MRGARKFVIASLGIGVAAFVAVTTAANAGTVSQSAGPSGSETSVAWTESGADNKAFFDAVLKSARERQHGNALATVTITYNAGSAPTFTSQISQTASIWNGSVRNVKLQATSGRGDFSYREGNSAQGSYASTDGHGHGYIFIDYKQARQYYPLRIVAHETGHVLGLPDHYTGPCSELMSGGGPGPSCRNTQPNAAERARVDRLWASGLDSAELAAQS